jgi:hypothetical protein
VFYECLISRQRNTDTLEEIQFLIVISNVLNLYLRGH